MRVSVFAMIASCSLAYAQSASEMLIDTPFDAEARYFMDSVPCLWGSVNGRLGPSYGSKTFNFSCKAGIWGTVTLLLEASETSPKGINRMRLAFRTSPGMEMAQAPDALVADQFLRAILDRYVAVSLAQEVYENFWNNTKEEWAIDGTRVSVWKEKNKFWEQHWLDVELPRRNVFPYSSVIVKPELNALPAPIGVHLPTDVADRVRLDKVKIGQPNVSEALDTSTDDEKISISPKPATISPSVLPQTRRRPSELNEEKILIQPSVLTIMPTSLTVFAPSASLPAFPQHIPTAKRVDQNLAPEVFQYNRNMSSDNTNIVILNQNPQKSGSERGAAPLTLLQRFKNTIGVSQSVIIDAPLPNVVKPTFLQTQPAPESLISPTPPPAISSSLVPTPEMLQTGRAPVPTNFSAYSEAEKLTRDIEQRAAQNTTGLMQSPSPTQPRPQATLPAVPTPQVQQTPAQTPASTGLTLPETQAPTQPIQPLDPRFAPTRALPQLQFIPKAKPLDTRNDVIRFEDEGSGL